MRSSVRALAGMTVALGAASLVIGQTAKREAAPMSIEGKQWPAPVMKDPPAAPPPLSPADALKTFTMPAGWQLQLVAAEPLVQDPILSEYDGDGRLWVMEMPGFAVNEAVENSFAPINQLVVLDDTDGDGMFDKRTVFADKLIMPRAFKVLANGCALIGEPPNLWKACDTNGDLKADTKEKISDTFATQGVVEHGANGLYWGMDNTIYVSEHDWNVTYKGGKFATEPTLRRGQWGITQDDGGRIYRNVNTDPLFTDYVPGKYYARNPNIVRTRGLYEMLAEQEKSNIWPARPTLGINRGYRKETTREDGSSSYYQSVSSPMIYRGDRLPKELYGQPFVVDGATNLVHLLRLQDDGTGNLKTTDWYPRGEFLTSTDERFRPVALTPSWDGSFLILDMYRGVSQDGPLQTDYLRQYVLQHKLWQGIHYGRIYRAVYKGMTADRRPQMSKDSSATLVTYLNHPNGWWRDTAQQLLVQRADKSVVPALKTLAEGSPDARVRLQAMWTLDGMGGLEKATVRRALADASPDVRASALRVAEPFMADSAIRTAVLKLSGDQNWLVKRQLAASLGALPGEPRLTALIALLRSSGNDPITVDAAVTSLSGQEEQALAELLKQPGTGLEAVSMLAGAVGKGRDATSVRELLALATDSRQPEPIRLALMNGLNSGLRGGVPQVNQQVAGGRAGGGVPGAGRRGAGTKPIDLAAEPGALSTLAKGNGSQAEMAQQLIEVVNWPGKPVTAVATVARTAQQQALFASGQGIYGQLCVGCHMGAGEGAPNVGAALAGSRFVNAAPTVSARILLAGKEGPIGLMPPIGATMSDEELAAILTFIRGSFGNTSSPVAPAEAKEWRTMYAFRKLPWTEQELIPAGGGSRAASRR